MGVIKGDTRSLDYAHRGYHLPGFRFRVNYPT